jgi:hypothetical protein
LGEDSGCLCHKVNAAEDDIVGSMAVGGITGELERVTPKISELDDAILLIVVPEDYQLVTQSGFEF